MMLSSTIASVLLTGIKLRSKVRDHLERPIAIENRYARFPTCIGLHA